MSVDKANPFSDMTDEQLVDLAAADKSALTALIVRYTSPISAKATLMRTTVVDYDDLLQEGVMGILDAVKAFKSSEGASFKTFANVCVRNRLLKLVAKNKEWQSCLEIEELLNASVESPESIVVQTEYEKQLFESISQRLTSAEWNVLQLYLRGFSYSGIASQLGITVKAADSAMQRVRRKLKSVLET